MLKKILLGVAGLVLVLIVVGFAAGGGATEPASETFDDERFGITFEYPGDLQKTDKVETEASAGGKATVRTVLAIDESNGIIVERFALRRRVTDGNLERFVGELDTVVGRLGTVRGDTRRSTLGGLPALRYDVGLATPKGGVSDVVFLFDGKVEYEVNCQSTPDERAALDKACEQVLATIARRE